MILFLHMGEHRLTSQTLNVLIPISMDILPIGQGSSDDNNSAPFSWVNFKGLSAEDQVFCKVPIQQLGFTAVLQHFRSRNSTYGGSLSARSLDKISDARRQKRPLVRVLAGWSSDSRGIDDHEPIEKTMIPRLDHGTIWFYDLWCVLYIYILFMFQAQFFQGFQFNRLASPCRGFHESDMFVLSLCLLLKTHLNCHQLKVETYFICSY